MKQVKFTRYTPPYNADELASFPGAQADAFVKAGQAVYAGGVLTASPAEFVVEGNIATLEIAHTAPVTEVPDAPSEGAVPSAGQDIEPAAPVAPAEAQPVETVEPAAGRKPRR